MSVIQDHGRVWHPSGCAEDGAAVNELKRYPEKVRVVVAVTAQHREMLIRSFPSSIFVPITT